MKTIIRLLLNNKWTASLATVVAGVLVEIGVVDVENAETVVAAILAAILAVLGSEADTKSAMAKE